MFDAIMLCLAIIGQDKLSENTSNLSMSSAGDDWKHISMDTYNNGSISGDEGEYTYISNDTTSQPNAMQAIQITQRIVIPLICAFGLVGNLLNLVIFTRRLCSKTINAVERGAVMSLAALALSDLSFCLITCLGSMMRTHRIVFTHYDLEYAYQVYNNLLRNLFIKTSTWLTMVAAVSRYAAVCYPLWARQFIRLSHIKIALITCFIASFLLHIPLIWEHEIQYIPCGNQTIKVFDTGLFFKNEILNRTFTYLSMILGFFIPIVVLTYCNVGLIISYRHSMKTRREMSRHQKKASMSSDTFTVTLIAVAIFFILLITPSEIFHIYDLFAAPTKNRIYHVIMVGIVYCYWIRKYLTRHHLDWSHSCPRDQFVN